MHHTYFRKGRLRYFAGKLLCLWMAAPFVLGGIGMTIMMQLGPDKLTTERLRRDMKEIYDLDIDKTAYVGSFYFSIDEYGNKCWNIKAVSITMIIYTMMGFPLFAIFYFGIKSYKIIRGLVSQGESEYSRRLQTQLYKALVAQTLIPLFFLFIPIVVSLGAPFFGLTLELTGLIVGTLPTLYPVLDPTPIIFLVDDYRNAFLNFFRRIFSKNEVTSVTHYEPNMDSISP
ncbi:hypothetical protein GCK72_013203 [Caenorhabditis remanei]|uniref:Seven TM Receptor n=1 Tax=Caenorhabditis remanei TaxID=31234 RepID=A0A6A5GQK4_CAERE|nr:hypothetical protein GCK72_013203 [Caenorhabditis remanei]KAF1756749.1 hypothetical protein GCK72_013203 [Caenorhabditis remanei]